jgi:hypothetical protein
VKTGETQSVLLLTHASCVSGLAAPGLAPPRRPRSHRAHLPPPDLVQRRRRAAAHKPASSTRAHTYILWGVMQCASMMVGSRGGGAREIRRQSACSLIAPLPPRKRVHELFVMVYFRPTFVFCPIFERFLVVYFIPKSTLTTRVVEIRNVDFTTESNGPDHELELWKRSKLQVLWGPTTAVTPCTGVGRVRHYRKEGARAAGCVCFVSEGRAAGQGARADRVRTGHGAALDHLNRLY